MKIQKIIYYFILVYTDEIILHHFVMEIKRTIQSLMWSHYLFSWRYKLRFKSLFTSLQVADVNVKWMDSRVFPYGSSEKLRGNSINQSARTLGGHIHLGLGWEDAFRCVPLQRKLEFSLPIFTLLLRALCDIRICHIIHIWSYLY